MDAIRSMGSYIIGILYLAQIEMIQFIDFLSGKPNFETATVVLYRKHKNSLQVLIGSKKKKSKKIWVLPGGRKKKNESIKDAARRELEEETGIPFSGKLDYLAKEPDKKGNWHYCFVGMAEDLVEKPKGADDLDTAKWVPVKHLPKMAFNHEMWIKAGKSIA